MKSRGGAAAAEQQDSASGASSLSAQESEARHPHSDADLRQPHQHGHAHAQAPARAGAESRHPHWDGDHRHPRSRHLDPRPVFLSLKFWASRDTLYLALLIILVVQTGFFLGPRYRDLNGSDAPCVPLAPSARPLSTALSEGSVGFSFDSREGYEPAPGPEAAADPERVRQALQEVRGFPAPESIPGTSFNTSSLAAVVQQKIDCLARIGAWQLNNHPRWIPWDLNPLNNPQQPNYKICDETWKSSGGGIYGADAEKARLSGAPWKVREALKYQWVTLTTQVPAGDGSPESAGGGGNSSTGSGGEEAGAAARSPEGALASLHQAPLLEGAGVKLLEDEGGLAPCRFRQFNRTGFCRVAAGLRILLVGDSMQLQFHDALLNHLVDPQDPLDDVGDLGDARTPCGGHLLCGHIPGTPKVYLRVVRNDQLSLTAEGKAARNQPWIRLLRQWKPDVLVLNRGAHYRANSLFKKQMRQALAEVRKKAPHVLVLWRNTPPGHVSCFMKKYNRVLRQRQDPKKVSLPFNWGKLAKQNIMARQIIASFGLLYMDVDYATALRGDGHIQTDKGWDCLHYCSPGPVDHWVNLFYNILLVLNGTLQHMKGNQQKGSL